MPSSRIRCAAPDPPAAVGAAVSGGGLAASVIVPTRDRMSYLDLTLAALERQTFPTDRWELILADTGSRDDTPAVVRRYERRGRIPWGQGASGSDPLNEAIEAARGRVLIFLGDDRLPGPDFLTHHLSHHGPDPEGGFRVVVGDSRTWVHTHLFPPLDPAMQGVAPAAAFGLDALEGPGWREVLLFAGGSGDGGSPRPGTVTDSWAAFDGGNASAPRDAVRRAGGYETGLLTQGWRDRELAYRLQCAGGEFRYEPKASALRQFAPRPRPDAQRERQDRRRAFGKHPALAALAAEATRASRT